MLSKIGTHDGVKLWINLDFCGIFCGFTTTGLIMYGMFVTTKFVILPWLGFSIFGLLNILLFNSAAVLAAYSHFAAMTTDPGAVPKGANPLPEDEEEIDYEIGGNNQNPYKKYCRRCQAFKPSRAHHCSMCGRCIVKMDHHCPWVNNCIGINNHKLFILFTFWVFVISFYAIILVILKFLSCLGNRGGCVQSIQEQLFITFLMVESILFGLFTLCMMADQMSMLTTNQTKIDRLKKAASASANASAASVSSSSCSIATICTSVTSCNRGSNGECCSKEVAAQFSVTDSDDLSDISSNYDDSTVEFNEVFGGSVYSRCKLSWLVPRGVRFPQSYRDRIFGYTTISTGNRDRELSSVHSQDTNNSSNKIASAGDSLVEVEIGKGKGGGRLKGRDGEMDDEEEEEEMDDEDDRYPHGGASSVPLLQTLVESAAAMEEGQSNNIRKRN